MRFSNYTDDFGMITQNSDGNWDGGDSCHRTSTILGCARITKDQDAYDGTPIAQKYEAVMNALRTDKGYRRHPDTTKWYSNPENFSRDQTVMLLFAFVMFGDSVRAGEVARQLLHNKGLHNNIYPNYESPGTEGFKKKFPDVITPTELSLLIRGSKCLIAAPLLQVLDLFFLTDLLFAAIDDYRSKRKGKRTDQYVMLATNLLTSKKKYPTIAAWATRKLMKFVDYKNSFNWLFGTPGFNDPPIHEILTPICEKYIDNNEEMF